MPEVVIQGRDNNYTLQLIVGYSNYLSMPRCLLLAPSSSNLPVKQYMCVYFIEILNINLPV